MPTTEGKRPQSQSIKVKIFNAGKFLEIRSLHYSALGWVESKFGKVEAHNGAPARQANLGLPIGPNPSSP